MCYYWLWRQNSYQYATTGCVDISVQCATIGCGDTLVSNVLLLVVQNITRFSDTTVYTYYTILLDIVLLLCVQNITRYSVTTVCKYYTMM